MKKAKAILGQSFVSEHGRKFTVIELDDETFTVAVERMVKGNPETRRVTMPHELYADFAKPYPKKVK